MSLFLLNALAPAVFLLVERAVFNQDPRGYLEFSHVLAKLGFLPPDTLLREWTLWEEAYKYARPGANFGYEAQAFVIFIIPCIFIAWHIIETASATWTKMLFWTVAIVFLASLLLSLSRTGIFTFLICCLIYVQSRHKFTVAAFTVSLIAILIIIFPDNYFLQRYTMQSHDAYSFTYKFLQIFDAFKATVSKPMSLVFGNPDLMDKSKGGFNPHNQFLADLMTKGLGAFVFGLTMFWILLKKLDPKSYVELKSVEDSNTMHLKRVLRICVYSVLIQCFSTQILPNTNTAIMLWIPIFFILQVTPEKKAYLLKWR